MSVIEVNNLTKYYGKSLGIEDVSFQVEEGEIGFPGVEIHGHMPFF